MEEKPKPRRGPKPKLPEERFRMMSFRFPPALWAEIRRWIPVGKRTEIVKRCLMRAIAAEKARKNPND